MKKPSTTFSSVTLAHCVRKDGLGLDIKYIDDDAPSLHIPKDPKDISSLVQSDFLCETLVRIKNVWVLDNEKACRIVIDAILTEVLLNDANEKLLGFCEVKNDWEGIF